MIVLFLSQQLRKPYKDYSNSNFFLLMIIIFADTLYDSFIESFHNEITSFKSEDYIMNVENDVTKSLVPKETTKQPESQDLSAQFWSFQDEFLMMAFKDLNIFEQANGEATFENTSMPDSDVEVLGILSGLNRASQIILPLEDIVVKSFANILKSRISFANSFVMNMYKNEFKILTHLQNMRKVMLLEASDVMQTFHIQLFKQVSITQ